jgi:hypothetical protein
MDVHEAAKAAATTLRIPGLYLLCYHGTAGDPSRPGAFAKHYLGFAVNIEQRVTQHENGTSKASLPTWFARKGITFTVARVWPGGTREDERKRKNAGHFARLCPCCKAALATSLPTAQP